jgi:transposase
MEHYAGIDVSLELSSVCVVDTQGKIVKETKVASEPEALVDFAPHLYDARISPLRLIPMA